jgi:hypothetical protein
MTREEAHKAALDAKAHWDGSSSEAWLIGCLVAFGVLKLDESDHDSDFAVTIDRQKQIITICGINYAFDLFRGLGFKINPEAFFQIVERGDGVVTIRETRRTNADA